MSVADLVFMLRVVGLFRFDAPPPHPTRMVGKTHNLRGTARAVKRLPEYPGKVGVVLDTDGREERLLFPDGDPRLAALVWGCASSSPPAWPRRRGGVDLRRLRSAGARRVGTGGALLLYRAGGGAAIRPARRPATASTDYES
jgi:hypothetical protein